jgi:Electron transfer DM13
MKKLLYILLAILVLGALWFAYYAISPLFRNTKVDEAVPQGQVEIAEQTDQKQTISATVIGTTGHPASGTARIVAVEGKRYVRYENFKTINGPDLYVYLAKDLDAKDFVSLGTLRATEGNINYEIPEGINPLEYQYVLTWCKQFGVLFNYADLKIEG